jgi:CBS domain containing-hemolysin-like protein
MGELLWTSWLEAATGTPAMLFGVFVLLAASAFFSGSETALVSASRARLESLADEGFRDARTALTLLHDTPKTIASILVGTNVSNIAASSMVTVLSIRFVPEEHAALISTLVLTPVVLFAAEILPKAFFRIRPARNLRVCAGALRAFGTLFTPIVALTSGATRFVLFVLRIPPAERRPVFRRKDLENLLLFGATRRENQDDDSDGTAMRMAVKALDLRKRTVSQAMVPLPMDRGCPPGTTVADAVERFRTVGGRFLAILDESGSVAGFVFARRLLGEAGSAPLERFAQSPYVLDLSDTMDDVIHGFRRHQKSIGIVRGRDGETLGVVTLGEVFAEVVGEIRHITTHRPKGPHGSQRKH